MRNPHKMTKHHIIAKRERLNFHIANAGLKRLPWYRHFALHQLFKTGHPQAQLEEFQDIIERVMSDEAKELLQQLIDLPLEDFYKEGLVKKRRRKGRY